MYKQTKTHTGETSKSIIRTADGACIPFDPTNTDYIEYLHWLSLDDTPLEAEVSIAVQPTEQPSLTTKGDNIV